MQFDMEQATSVFSRAPSVFDALLRDLPDSWVVHDLGHIAQATRGWRDNTPIRWVPGPSTCPC